MTRRAANRRDMKMREKEEYEERGEELLYIPDIFYIIYSPIYRRAKLFLSIHAVR